MDGHRLAHVGGHRDLPPVGDVRQRRGLPDLGQHRRRPPSRFYALLKGKVVTVNEAACETHLPETPRGIFKQRTRWAKSAWLGLPFVLTNMRPWFIFWYTYPLLFQAMFPLAVVLLSYIWIVYGVPTLIYGVSFWFVTGFCMTGAAYQQRPSMRTRDKLIQMSLACSTPSGGCSCSASRAGRRS